MFLSKCSILHSIQFTCNIDMVKTRKVREENKVYVVQSKRVFKTKNGILNYNIFITSVSNVRSYFVFGDIYVCVF